MQKLDVLWGHRNREHPDLVCNERPVIDRHANALTRLSVGLSDFPDTDRLFFVFLHTYTAQLIFPESISVLDSNVADTSRTGR
ncbi:hypothetical protein QQF64_020970 [Cirrhinus molitorella]|uniref:Uncharacterized protein n=1 Tax=Cirrhinus molitorella TaxID=172907 RepID=A0ABR3LAN5_9TELE